ncbi:hypothetical protein DCM91_09175 [Chitinophaga costaii]|nr:hypothetical protein DCM91_09175 [Chitinophaga costaii]
MVRSISEEEAKGDGKDKCAMYKVVQCFCKRLVNDLWKLATLAHFSLLLVRDQLVVFMVERVMVGII